MSYFYIMTFCFPQHPDFVFKERKIYTKEYVNFVNWCIWYIEGSRNFWNIKYVYLSDYLHFISQRYKKNMWIVWLYKVTGLPSMEHTRPFLKERALKTCLIDPQRSLEISPLWKSKSLIMKLEGSLWCSHNICHVSPSFSFFFFFFGLLKLLEHIKLKWLMPFRNVTGKNKKMKTLQTKEFIFGYNN